MKPKSSATPAMGLDRDYRITIPGALLLLTFFIGGLGAGGFHESPLTQLDAQWVAAIAVLVVANFGGGFLCSNVTVLVLSGCPWRRSERTAELRPVLGTSPDDSDEQVWGKAHLRFHSEADEKLIHFATGRNTAMFACFNSAIGLIVGWCLAFLSVSAGWLPTPTFGGWITLVSLLLVILIVTILLIINGRRARTEHWQVFIQFLHERQQSLSVPVVGATSGTHTTP
ncbi:MAG: hypothetical protein ACYC3X_16790 [Pirellulaceae bacterium]